jgi:hypothetical protein
MKWNEFQGELSILSKDYKFSFKDGKLVIHGATGEEAARMLEMLDIASESLHDLQGSGPSQVVGGDPPSTTGVGGTGVTEPEPAPVSHDGEEPPAAEPKNYVIGEEFEGQKIVGFSGGSGATVVLQLADESIVTVDRISGKVLSRTEPQRDEPAEPPKSKKKRSGQELKADILKFFKANPKMGLTAKPVAKALGIPEDDLQSVRSMLSRMENDKQLVRRCRGVYSLAQTAEPEAGPVQTNTGKGGGPQPTNPEITPAPTNGGASELPQEIREAADLFPVLSYFRNQGVVDESEIVARCVSSSSEINCLKGVADVEDRVKRVLDMLA